MASFVESATLIVTDKSSSEINKINRALTRLFKTTEKLKNVNIKMKVDDSKLAKADADAKRLAATLKKLTSTKQSITPRMNLAPARSQAQGFFAWFASRARRAVPFGFGAGAGIDVYRGVRAGVVTAGQATVDAEAARIRVRQAGFSEPEARNFEELSREVQKQFPQIPAAEILNASVEQLSALRASNAPLKDYEIAMRRVAANAQRLAITYKSSAAGAEGARQMERFSQILGQDVNDPEIKKLQKAAFDAVVASGGEISIDEAVRTIQQLKPGNAKSMSPQALTDLLLVRDEGGRSSTADWRMALNDLKTGSLNPADELAQIALGLRKQGKKGQGLAIPEIVEAAYKNPVNFADDVLRPLLEKADLGDAPSAVIASWLDENGFNASGAQAWADILTSLRSKEFQRQRDAASRVDDDPELAKGTFAATTREFVASFETAMARNLDKLAPAFTAATIPLSQSIAKAGELGGNGDYVAAGVELGKGVTNFLGGPGGTIVGAIGLQQGLKDLLTAGDPLSRGAALLEVGASTLLVVANQFTGFFNSLGFLLNPVGSVVDQLNKFGTPGTRAIADSMPALQQKGQSEFDDLQKIIKRLNYELRATPPLANPYAIDTDTLKKQDQLSQAYMRSNSLAEWLGTLKPLASDTNDAGTAAAYFGASATAAANSIAAVTKSLWTLARDREEFQPIKKGALPKSQQRFGGDSAIVTQLQKLVGADPDGIWGKQTERQYKLLQAQYEQLEYARTTTREAVALVEKQTGGKLPDTAPVPQSGTVDRMLLGVEQGVNSVQAVFDTGTAGTIAAGQQAANGIAVAMDAGGVSAASKIQAAIIAGGAGAAANIAAAVANIRVSVGATAPAPDTGANQPSAG